MLKEISTISNCSAFGSSKKEVSSVSSFFFDRQTMDSRERKLKVMEELDNHLEELEEFSNSIKEYRDMDIEYEEGDVDELLLEGLEGHAPPRMEPALVLCWFIVGVVSFYVAWLGVMGAGPHKHDEL